MHGKEFVLDCFRTYFIVVTLINVVMCIMGLYLMPEQRFGYEAFAVPLIYGLAGTVPNIVMYSKRELKIKELMIRKVLQFILIEVCVLFAAFYGGSKQWCTAENIGIVAACILVIYVLACLFDWVQNSLSAKQMTEDLKKFQGMLQEE